MENKAVLLHCCCGPCSIYPLQALGDEGFSVTGLFYNPNIHPYREFSSRLEAFQQMAKEQDLQTIIDERYGLSSYLQHLSQLANEGEEQAGNTIDVFARESTLRCRYCYESRLDYTARACLDLGFTLFSTTLLVSPYQDHHTIQALGESIGDAYGLQFLYRDFRDGFRKGQQKAREMGLYMQGYCACIFSEYLRYGDRG